MNAFLLKIYKKTFELKFHENLLILTEKAVPVYLEKQWGTPGRGLEALGEDSLHLGEVTVVEPEGQEAEDVLQHHALVAAVLDGTGGRGGLTVNIAENKEGKKKVAKK